MTRETDISIYARIFGLIDANGAGKSTLLKLVARMAPLLALSAGFHVDEACVAGVDLYLNRTPTGVFHS